MWYWVVLRRHPNTLELLSRSEVVSPSSSPEVSPAGLSVVASSSGTPEAPSIKRTTSTAAGSKCEPAQRGQKA